MPNPTSNHILQSYDRELDRLTALLAKMAGLCETQVLQAIRALTDRDVELAERTAGDDIALDALEREVEGLVIRLLALRAPVAVDLRTILGALKMASIYERVGDNAKHVARRAVELARMPEQGLTARVAELGQAALRALHLVNNAIADGNLATAEQVWVGDKEVDRQYLTLVEEIGRCAKADPGSVTACMHLHFAAKAFERVGDHATNLAEQVAFQAAGRRPTADRPKLD